jgi:hypothetical protein
VLVGADSQAEGRGFETRRPLSANAPQLGGFRRGVKRRIFRPEARKQPERTVTVPFLAECLDGGPQRAATEAVVGPDGELPVVFARHRCLFDHFQRLQDELAGIGHQAGIEIDDASVSELEQPNSLRPL